MTYVNGAYERSRHKQNWLERLLVMCNVKVFAAKHGHTNTTFCIDPYVTHVNKTTTTTTTTTAAAAAAATTTTTTKSQ